MNTEMSKAYEPRSVEDAVSDLWLSSGYCNPDNLPNVDPSLPAFSLVLPPPNVTGTLHIGHATMLAIEDALVRFARLQGRSTLWLPGTDHAAIATQSKVEKILKEDGLSRHDLGREAFLARVTQFAQDSHDTIVHQVKKMGSSVDWSREAYTLDAARNTAVNTAFKRMYDDGLIYRGTRVINWDPVGQTTIADDEIVHKEVEATLYTFTYSTDFPIAIATTRPETKVGDTAVAVNPNDERYKEFVGKTIDVKDFCGTSLSITIIADESVDKDFGTGALGVTPAHSTIDADIAARHGLAMKPVITEQATMLDNLGMLSNLPVQDARKVTVAWLREHNLLISEEKIVQNLSTAERTGGVIEPLPKLQWFVNVNKEFERDGKKVTLKSLMQDAVKSGDITILPDRFTKTYFHWIDNLRDWCISRQIWFGHRIPVWYRGKEIAVGEAPDTDGWIQDSDTLDTWFSSGLWTFSTLGWPSSAKASEGKPDDLTKFHPTTVLETGYDILFFWVARMVLMSTYLLGDVPFKTVYLHGLVRDEQGRKMSKSLGNIIDPLTMIEKYGADATRLALVLGSSPGNDVKLSEEKIAGFRNFTNKLWNISRFVLSGVAEIRHIETVAPKTLADAWILSRLAVTTQKVTSLHTSYDLSLAGEVLREFTWNDFADWYLEVAKIEKGKDEVLLFVLERLLILWHPFMPFVTEEIYRQWNNGLLMVARWPKVETLQPFTNVAVEKQFSIVQDIVAAIRNIRSQYHVEPKQEIDAYMWGEDVDIGAIEIISALTRTRVKSASPAEQTTAKAVVGAVTIAVPLSGMIDIEKERLRLQKDIASVEDFAGQLALKLNNPEFTARAPQAVVAQEQQKLTEAQTRLAALKREFDNLK
jgi:valyl-tRNA synthetase